MAQAKMRAVPRRVGSPCGAELSDGQLLGRFHDRLDDSAEAAFADLVRRHGPMVWRVCDQILGDRHDAEDAFQASFLVLARKSQSIRRPELLGNWLYGVALRTAREARTRAGRRRRRETTEAAVDHVGATAGTPPEAALIGREELAALHEEVARLPERYRVAVVLCELEGLTYQEVARRLDCPVSTVGVRLGRARARLRDRLIRRGVAPAAAAALVDALLGAGNAAAVLSGALVDATVRAAMAGLVPAAVVALLGTVLWGMRLTQFQVLAGFALVIGLGGTGAWLASYLPTRALASGERIALRQVHWTLSPSDPAAAIAARSVAGPPVLGTSPAVVPTDPPPPAEPPLPPVSNRRGEREEVARGEALFFKEWVARDPASPRGDGLGPVFNETSCVSCHGLGAPGGAGPANKNVLLLTASVTGGPSALKGLERIHPGFGNSRSIVLHRYGTDSTYRSWRRSFLHPESVVPPPAAQQAASSSGATANARIGQIIQEIQASGGTRDRSRFLTPIPGVTLRPSERNSPALFGAGQIDALTAGDLDDQARWEPEEVRGRVSHTPDGRVGRFGWKAQVAGLHEFVRSACASEIGLEVPEHAQATSPLAPGDKAPGLDLTQSDCDALVAYVRALPAPLAVDPAGPHGSDDLAAGRRLFAGVGCASCHAPSVGPVRGIYSDLLLHKMGGSLSDSGSYYGGDSSSPDAPTGDEWRTPPLWGYRDSGPYLHDGRAETLEEAVALHGGQASASSRDFFNLSAPDQGRIESFLKSLVAPSSAAPGLVLAAELEARIEPAAIRQAEALVRQERTEVEALEVARKAEAVRRERAEAAARRAVGQFQMGSNLEKSGKTAGALEFYRLIVRDAPDTAEGRSSAARIDALARRLNTP